MIIRTQTDGFIHPLGSEITPQAVFLDRRRWLAQSAVALGSAWGLGHARDAQAAKGAPLKGVRSTVAGAMALDALTPYADVTGYNNFYEFGLDKADPARNAHTLKTTPWTVSVEGMVAKARTWGLEELLKLAPMEERIYRLRCVEGWSMVVPWVGYSLSALIRAAQPLGSARYVEFVTQADPATMPGLRNSVLNWPYLEGLRLDEAQHPLTLLTFGVYGEVLPNQNGAPLRLVLPWKYGFKSGKSIVKIRFTDREPRTSWNVAAPREYGFYANVNPAVPHPRWSQATERRIGEAAGLFAKRRPTELFNGYGPQVASMYAGMDLRRSY
ncbi:MAG: protein-methionine-sulfoxide reductase catalytic subunit MsrP [Hydrogenophaga sp.]|nr:protein-methionine-sulfoxide reductase catalytic subunit MsrP [Hydrogenophaga sp.]